MVILHGFIRQDYQKAVQSLPLFPIYGKLPYFSLNYHISRFQKNAQNYLFP